jgi:localization factor PodJL
MPPPMGVSLSDAASSDTTQPAKPTAKAETDAVPLASDKIGSLALRTAAANGDAKAQFEVAMRYSEGRGLAPDPREAAIWFERSATRGFGPAAYRLGSAYEKGLGIDRNPAEAKRWYRQAAEAGNVRAMHNLGVLYANDRDMPSALPWFQKAADAGLKDSQFKLAVSTWRPQPISRDANEETAVWSEPVTTGSIKPAAPVAPTLPTGWNSVMQAQAALQGKGYYAGKIDGELTPETKAAIRAFQKKNGLRASGEIDNAFLNAVVAKQM